MQNFINIFKRQYLMIIISIVYLQSITKIILQYTCFDLKYYNLLNDFIKYHINI